MIQSIQEQHGIVGRTHELGDLLACIQAGRHVLLEGPVGVGKTAVAKAVAAALGRGFVRVDGDGRYTESRLVGQFDPPMVLEQGYKPEAFVAGPLLRAMLDGGVLLLNELNRMPEGVQNVLLPSLDEGLLLVPHLGAMHAAPGFVVIATQNPAEFVATGDLSEALQDRFELVKLDYQTELEERAIVASQTLCSPSAAVIEQAVRMARATRNDPRIRRGASVRAAIAIADIAMRLNGDVDRAARLALPTRIELVDERGDALSSILDSLKKKVAEEEEEEEQLKPPKPTLNLTKSATVAAKPDPNSKFMPFFEADSGHVQLSELPAGWEAAQNLHRLKKTLPDKALRLVTERALDAIIQRAKTLLRHAAHPTHLVRSSWPEPGDLDLDATLERPRQIPMRGQKAPWRPEDIVVSRQEPRDADVVAILDMSLSMTGEKIALVAVAAAILRMKLESVSIVAFDTNAHVLVRLGEKLPIRELVRRILMVPAQGYTHISAGLEAGLEQLQRSGKRERVGLLLSDGISNVGWDPVRVAKRYPTLHVVQLGRDLPQGSRACRGMAQAGRGRRFHAPTYVALPGVVKRVIREVFRV